MLQSRIAQLKPVSFDRAKVIVGPRHRSIVYADRFRGVSYVDVCDHLIRLRNAPPFGGKSELVIDGTSLGRVVSDILWDQSVDHHAVQMTGGQQWGSCREGGGNLKAA